MSIDKAIVELKAALEANTAALQTLITAGGNAGKPVVEKTAEARVEKKAKVEKKAEPTFTQDQLAEAATKLRFIFGQSTEEAVKGLALAKAILTKNGYAKLIDVKADDYGKVIAAFEAKVDELSAAGDDDGLSAAGGDDGL